MQHLDGKRYAKSPRLCWTLFPLLGKSISFVCVPSESQKIENNYKEKVSNWEVCIVRITQLSKWGPWKTTQRAAAVEVWQWLSPFPYSTVSVLTWKDARGPSSDTNVIFCDRIKDPNQMLLLKRCCTSSRKKKKKKLPVSLFQKRSWKIYENWEENSKNYSESSKTVAERKVLNTIQQLLLLEERPLPHPHTFLARKTCFLLDQLPQATLQQISWREEIFTRHLSHPQDQPSFRKMPSRVERWNLGKC